ncbi:hypothetical protein MTR67_023994 [Solanum verrucosum]|uniref:Uncharacterized protein n=1 Tax=Solanum verrucosum TaxID=315347 RepID=A0AAF0TSN1_SOLVR|nr:hypothetical protein MTR67_023994 [Solanum verrucosum]
MAMAWISFLKTGEMRGKCKEKGRASKTISEYINLEQQPLLEKGNAKILSSGKVVGDLGNWIVVKDRRDCPSKSNTSTTVVGELAKEWVAKSFGPVLHGENYKDKEQVGDNITQQNLSKNEASLRGGQESQPNSTLTSPPIEARKMSVEHEGVYNNKEDINIPSSQEEEILGDESADDTKMDTPQSPNEVLHNILTHKESEFEHLQLRDTNFQVEDTEDKIFRDADLSPRSIKSMEYANKGGDFNVVLNGEEKIGGRPVTGNEVEDFHNCIESNDLYQVQFKGSPFTWWNGRADFDCIFERLDRIFVNNMLQDQFNISEVEHLSRNGSDHAPLLFSCENRDSKFIKPFRFLNFWTEHRGFKDVIKINWDDEYSSNSFSGFQEED